MLGSESRDVAGLKARLETIVLGDAWLTEALGALRDAEVPEGYIGAGVIRDKVWDELFGRREPERRGDVDVAYFDRKQTQDFRRVLAERAPKFRWDVVNQALIHHWQGRALGRELPPYPSLSAAVGAWPETATAVAVRWTRFGSLDVIAPCGLADLFDGVLRQNPRTPDRTAFARRLRQHDWRERWPALRVEA